MSIRKIDTCPDCNTNTIHVQFDSATGLPENAEIEYRFETGFFYYDHFNFAWLEDLRKFYNEDKRSLDKPDEPVKKIDFEGYKIGYGDYVITKVE